VLLVDPNVLSIFANERYVLVLQPRPDVWIRWFPRRNREPPCRTLVTFLAGATAEDQLKAYTHCLLLERCLGKPYGTTRDSNGAETARQSFDVSTAKERRALVERTLVCTSLLFPNYLLQEQQQQTSGGVDGSKPLSLVAALADRGWDVRDRMYLGFPRQRFEWTSDDTKID
jgi:hypothetical protein